VCTATYKSLVVRYIQRDREYLAECLDEVGVDSLGGANVSVQHVLDHARPGYEEAARFHADRILQAQALLASKLLLNVDEMILF
jgi:hypothetical protein